MANNTLNFAWDKPVVSGDNNAWGAKLNTLFDDADADLKTVSDAAAAATAVGATFTTRDTAVQKVKYLGFAAFQPNNDEDDITRDSATYVQSDNDIFSLFDATFSLPAGATLDSVDVYLDLNGQPSVNVAVNSVSLAGVKTTLASGSRSSAGVGPASMSSIAHTVGDEFLSIHVAPTGSGTRYRIYGAKITYTRHSLAEVD